MPTQFLALALGLDLVAKLPFDPQAVVACVSLLLLLVVCPECVFRTNPITRFGPIRSAVSEFSITRHPEALSA
jgi:hypothetical protein